MMRTMRSRALFVICDIADIIADKVEGLPISYILS